MPVPVKEERPRGQARAFITTAQSQQETKQLRLDLLLVKEQSTIKDVLTFFAAHLSIYVDGNDSGFDV